ncbi:recombinase family protein [Streptomyces sp. NPDC093064]|uniref:recombinase family protein n=1 Tax=Streptomyces sp. NPDC093064 TaxID=3366020 RepID=UPI003818ADD0
MGCDPVFSEKISTRVKVRPEFVKAMDFARTIKKAVPHQRVIFTVHEMKRLGRGAAELLAIAEDLRHHDIQLELLTGPLQGSTTPPGTAPPSSRSSPAWRSPSASTSARSPWKARRPPASAAGTRPKVVDDDMADYARTLRANGVPVQRRRAAQRRPTPPTA